MSEKNIKKIILKLFYEELGRSVGVFQEGMEMQKDFIADSPGPMQSRYDSAMVEGQWLLASMQKNQELLVKGMEYVEKLLDAEEETYDAVREGALVLLRQSGTKSGYLLLGAAGCGGVSVLYEGERYMGITLQSPLGRALLGKKAGDEIELRTSRRVRYVVEAVS